MPQLAFDRIDKVSKNFSPDTLFDSLKEITSETPEFKGWEYLAQWGSSFSHEW